MRQQTNLSMTWIIFNASRNTRLRRRNVPRTRSAPYPRCAWPARRASCSRLTSSGTCRGRAPCACARRPAPSWRRLGPPARPPPAATGPRSAASARSAGGCPPFGGLPAREEQQALHSRNSYSHILSLFLSLFTFLTWYIKIGYIILY